MGARGQNPESWLARWRKGDCPIHGTGLVADTAASSTPPGDGEHTSGDGSDDADEGASGPEDGVANDGIAVRCPREGCTMRACQWPGHDDAHSFFGWLEGPAEIRAVLARAGDIAAEGPRPSHHARSVRTAWPLPENA